MRSTSSTRLSASTPIAASIRTPCRSASVSTAPYAESGIPNQHEEAEERHRSARAQTLGEQQTHDRLTRPEQESETDHPERDEMSRHPRRQAAKLARVVRDASKGGKENVVQRVTHEQRAEQQAHAALIAVRRRRHP